MGKAPPPNSEADISWWWKEILATVFTQVIATGGRPLPWRDMLSWDQFIREEKKQTHPAPVQAGFYQSGKL